MVDPANNTSGANLSSARGIWLAIALTLTLAVVICLACTFMGFLGSFLVDNGIATMEDITSLSTVIGVIIIGSTVLSAIVCTAIYKTFILPLRKMTAAVRQLAEGNFSFRVEPEKGIIHIREVDEFTESFNKAASELEGTEMMRAGFISDFSHEFRTPIASLSGFAQLLLEDDLSEDERREYLEIIYEESQRLAGLSERILLLSKMEASTILPKVESVDIAEQIRRCVMVLEPKLSEKNLQVDITMDECNVSGNADYLAQLWLNLLDNAVKFSPEGGSIGVALYGGRAEEEGRSNASDEAVVWISDEGCGMDSEAMDHIFDRFYQADSSHVEKGSGLGLSLCKRIVDLHGGSIEVQSAPGKGAVFEVRLPLKPAASRGEKR